MNYYFLFPYFNIINYIKKLCISNQGKLTTNYKSIHFIMNKKELNEEEIQNYILSDLNNEIVNLYQEKKEFFNIIIISELF
jgi:hypothetical protein